MEDEIVLHGIAASRHYLEIRCDSSDWEVIKPGTNETYTDSKLIRTAPW